MQVLRSMDTLDPPIRELTYQERYKRLWTEQGCLRETVWKVLDQVEKPCA